MSEERTIMVLGQMFLFLKVTYFMSLFDKVAPLIDIIVQIIFDIEYFMIILVIYTVCFTQCFYYIARNQIDFDDLTPEERSLIPYDSFTQSFLYVFGMVYGSTNTKPFYYGNSNQSHLLEFVFLLSIFVIQIHFLNLLIAIMGNTFAERKAVENKIMVKDHLNFVMDNWFLLNLAFPNKKKIRYIVTAFLS